MSSPLLEVCKQGCCRKGPRTAWNARHRLQRPAWFRHQLCDLGRVGSALSDSPSTASSKPAVSTLQGFRKMLRAWSRVFDERQHLPQPSLHTQEKSSGQTQARLAASHLRPQVQPGPGPPSQGPVDALLGPRVQGALALTLEPRGRAGLSGPFQIRRPVNALLLPSSLSSLWGAPSFPRLPITANYLINHVLSN